MYFWFRALTYKRLEKIKLVTNKTCFDFLKADLDNCIKKIGQNGQQCRSVKCRSV